MKDRTTRVLETCRTTQGFMDAHDPLLGDVNKSGARKTLDDVVTQLTAHAVNQDGGFRVTKGETANQRTLRLALRFNNMKPIADVARMKLRDVPNFSALTLPNSSMKGPRLVTAAGAMAETATPYAQTFVDGGLHQDFLAQLKTATEAVRNSLDTRSRSNVGRGEATKGLAVQEKRGRAVLKLLDGLVIPKLGGDEALIAGWKQARKIHAKPGPVIGSEAVAKTGGDVPPAPAPTPTPAPVVQVPAVVPAAPSSTSATPVSQAIVKVA